MADDIRISDDPAELDRDRIYRWIGEQSYWAKGRARERQEAAIDGSWNFGAYDSTTGEQLGFARLVTDRATFAWLCDVFVDEGARGRRVGKSLMAAIAAALDELGMPRTMLATADAHGLYAQYGFEPLAEPERLMARIPNSSVSSARPSMG
ncbi:MAG: GNAT family N-acetyltransferase [Pseudolysinimonas sp.]|uniref:GNAT family N-acetyltransferase n=1 Tax=Pseudolysinimonas sp. TaxID=2680009 RepID=UPI0032642E6E